MEKQWLDMSDKLSRLTIKQLKVICRDENINMQGQSNRKDTLVARIVAVRRKRTLMHEEGSRKGKVSPYLKFRSVKDMQASGSAYKGEHGYGYRA